MNKDWPEMAAELTGASKEVRLGSPEVTKAFSATGSSTRRQMAGFMSSSVMRIRAIWSVMPPC